MIAQVQVFIGTAEAVRQFQSELRSAPLSRKVESSEVKDRIEFKLFISPDRSIANAFFSTPPTGR